MQTYIHTYIHTYIYTYKHTYIHTYIHIYIYPYIHTHLFMLMTARNTTDPRNVIMLKYPRMEHAVGSGSHAPFISP